MPPVKRQPRVRRRHFLREWRLHRELTLEAAAERVGVDHSTLQRVEVGKSPYNQDLLEKLAFAYSCDPTDLLNVDPLVSDPIIPVINMLKAANSEMRQQALAVLAALLKSAS